MTAAAYWTWTSLVGKTGDEPQISSTHILLLLHLPVKGYKCPFMLSFLLYIVFPINIKTILLTLSPRFWYYLEAMVQMVCFYLKALRTAFKIHCQKHFLTAKMAVETTRPSLLRFCLPKALLLENCQLKKLPPPPPKLTEVFILLTTCTFHAWCKFCQIINLAYAPSFSPHFPRNNDYYYYHYCYHHQTNNDKT